MTEAASENVDESPAERSVEHRIDDRIGQRRQVAEPDQGRYDWWRNGVATLDASGGHDVDDEKWRPKHDEDGKNDAQNLGRLLLVAGSSFGHHPLLLG